MIGDVVDRYEVLRELGRGGMGLVYEVKDQRGYQRTYALKVMNPTVAAREDLVRRFMDEAKLLGELNDPNIVFAYDFWSTDNHTYLLMEFVEGGTLKELIGARGALPWPEALPLFEQVVSAISAAHERSIIHRDIKPSNVLLHRGYDGRPVVKVTDFGLAKIHEEAASDSMARTMSGMGGGTLPYMPPEQILGLNKTDKRSDVYALGLTLYTMLAGRNPFEDLSNSFAVQKAIVEHTFPPLKKAVEHVPKPIARFVDKATAKNPDDRYADAGEMLAELRRLQGRLAPEAATSTSFEALAEEPPPRSRRRWPLVAAAVAVPVVALVAFLGLRGFPDLTFSGGGTGSSAAPVTTVSIYTSPEDALVSVEGGDPAEAPLEGLELAPGRTSVRAEREGYALLDTVLDVRQGEGQEFALPLRPAEDVLAEGTGAKEEAPEQAANAATEAPPLDEPEDFVLSAGGEEEETRPEQTPTATETELETTAPEPQPPAMGGVSVVVRPYGDVHVNGEELAKGTNSRVPKELPPGTHRVRATHPTYGSWEKEVRVEPGQTEDVLFNFGQHYRVTVTSEPWAEIVVDGEPTGEYTPREMPLRAGPHTVSVQRDGYAMEGEPRTFTLEGDRTSAEDRLHFTLRPTQ